MHLQDINIVKNKKVKNIKDDQDVHGVIQILVKCEWNSWIVSLEDQDEVSYTVYLQDIIMMKNEEMTCKFKMSI